MSKKKRKKIEELPISEVGENPEYIYYKGEKIEFEKFIQEYEKLQKFYKKKVEKGE